MSEAMRWDLDSIFEGGSSSKEYRQTFEATKDQVQDLSAFIDQLAGKAVSADDLKQILDKQEDLVNNLSRMGTFVSALVSQDVTDTQAVVLSSELTAFSSQISNLNNQFQRLVADFSDAEWEALFEDPDLKEVEFVLNETRRDSKRLLSEAEEKLLSALKVDGFEGWSDHYDRIVQQVTFPFEMDNGQVEILSAGQAQNQLESHPSTEKRHAFLKVWEDQWQASAPLFADTLNHLAGFRLTDQEAHGIDSFLTPPLEYNRMEKATLDAMWTTISKNKDKLVQFMDRKAQLLGLEKLSYADLVAPVQVGDYQAKTFTWEETEEFIVENFAKFSPQMADLAQRAFDERWIEAEDRPGKRPGGYCSSLPNGDSRIFLTFSGSSNEVSTVAHEIGHAFHSYVMRDLPVQNQNYAMNVAETASTFAEIVVSDATLQAARSDEEKLDLLNDKISMAVSMFMNIHSRYIFEKAFYEERKKGYVSTERLNELMVEAQKEAYVDNLSDYHPTFWASKLHFYGTSVPFYNFPYTFGYLFATGIYARSLQAEGSFEEDYIALLRDTGSMKTEDLAMKHLDVDLTQEDFWQDAIDVIYKDVDDFLNLSQAYL